VPADPSATVSTASTSKDNLLNRPAKELHLLEWMRSARHSATTYLREASRSSRPRAAPPPLPLKPPGH
jgi:hypothetical protein